MDEFIGQKFGRWTVIKYSHKDKNRMESAITQGF